MDETDHFAFFATKLQGTQAAQPVRKHAGKKQREEKERIL
jgi:hypothetical protein